MIGMPPICGSYGLGIGNWVIIIRSNFLTKKRFREILGKVSAVAGGRVECARMKLIKKRLPQVPSFTT